MEKKSTSTSWKSFWTAIRLGWLSILLYSIWLVNHFIGIHFISHTVYAIERDLWPTAALQKGRKRRNAGRAIGFSHTVLIILYVMVIWEHSRSIVCSDLKHYFIVQTINKCALQCVPVLLGLIEKISSIRLYMPDDLRPKDARQAFEKSIAEVHKRFPQGSELLLLCYFDLILIYFNTSSSPPPPLSVSHLIMCHDDQHESIYIILKCST